MTEEQFQSLTPEKSYIGYAGGKYKVAGLNKQFGASFIEIYDEPPSNHVDQINAGSAIFIEDSTPTEGNTPASEQEETARLYAEVVKYLSY